MTAATSAPADVPAITRREAHALRMAARALRAIRDRNIAAGWDAAREGEHLKAVSYGRLAGVADHADDVLFDVCNVGSSYLEAPAANTACKRWRA